jgi:D-glycerate 3-kinase
MKLLLIVYDAVGLLIIYAFEWSDYSAVWTKVLSFLGVDILLEEYHKNVIFLMPCAGSEHSWIQDGSMNRNSTSSNKGMQGPLHSVFPSTPALVSSVEDLFEFICSGPLISKLGLTSEMIAESIDKWISYGLQLCRLFQLNELYLTVPQKARFYHYYIPVFVWCEDKISKHVTQFKDSEDIPPLVVRM